MIAFISVSDRTGAQELALTLTELGYDIHLEDTHSGMRSAALELHPTNPGQGLQDTILWRGVSL